jgi:two-component sensor histidine kinase/tetratricopeptide (TPR) repeat protein
MIKSVRLSFSVLMSLIFIQVLAQDSLYRVIETHPNDTMAVRAYSKLSAKLLRKNYDTALLFANKGRVLAIKLNDKKGYSDCLTRLGNAYSYKGEYDSAFAVYERALTLNESLGRFLDASKLYNNIGLIYRYKGDHVTSAEYFLNSLKLKKKYGTDLDIGVGLHNLGIVYAIQKDFEAAEQSVTESLDLYLKVGDSSKYYNALIDLGAMQREQGKYELAIKGFKKAYNYHSKIGKSTQMGICLYNMGVSSELIPKLDDAQEHFKNAKSIFAKLGNTVRITGCKIKLANIYLKKGNASKAENTAREALLVFPKLESPLQKYKLLDVLSSALAKQNKFKEAYAHRINYEKILDSIRLNENELKIAELKGQYEGELDKRKIAELTASNNENLLSARKKEIQNYVLAGVGALILLFALFFYSRARDKKKINDALREKNVVAGQALGEKEVLLREIYHRVQNNLQFVSSLLNLQSRQIEDQKTLDVLKDCRLRIQSMALVHQRLYQEENLKGINFKNYAQNLVESLQNSYHIERGRIVTQLEVEDISLDINSAIPVGLILNELITNSFKYAFPNGAKGILTIALKKEGNVLNLKFKDNGIGIPDGFDIDTSKSFGLKLVRSMATKLKADLKFNNTSGTEVVLQIREFEKV